MVLDIDFYAYSSFLHDSSISYVTSSEIDVNTWYARLGLIGHGRVSRLAKEGILGSYNKIKLATCDHCLAGKTIRKPFRNAIRANNPLKLIHSDI